jgi:hypothetical protein
VAASRIRGAKPTIVKEGTRQAAYLDEGSGRPLLTSALGKPGDDLLSRALRHSTIGAGAFHGRVRDGIGCSRSANITRPAKGGYAARSRKPEVGSQKGDRGARRTLLVSEFWLLTSMPRRGIHNESNQAYRAISTG